MLMIQQNSTAFCDHKRKGIQLNKRKKIQIIYLSPYDILRPRTNQISDIRFCESFMENGCDIDLIVPYTYREDNLDKDMILKYYEVKYKFPISYIKTNKHGDNISKIDYILLAFFMSTKVLNILKRRNSNKIVIISRSEKLLIPLMIMNKISTLKNLIIVPWLHDFRVRLSNEWVYKRANYIIATNTKILQDLNRFYGFPLDKTAITLNPISENKLENRIGKKSAREKIEYYSSRPLVVYTGKLFIGQKEIEYILTAATSLENVNFIFTGGKPDVIDFYMKYTLSKKIKNCYFTGYIHDYRKIRYYQSAADLLISYYTNDIHDVQYNLPNKFCEYMLTGNPIITPDFPATRDILNSENAFFVKPENSEDLSKMIEKVLADVEKAKEIGKKGFMTVKQNTYKKIAANIIELIL